MLCMHIVLNVVPKVEDGFSTIEPQQNESEMLVDDL